MGVDANFYFRTSVGPHDIMTALKAIGKTDVEFRATHTPEYVQLIFKSKQKGWDKRSMHFFFGSSDCFGFECNHVSLRSDDESIEIFTQLAKMIGGVLQESDCADDAIMFPKPGSGDFRWLIEQYYLRNTETPRDAENDIKAFVAWNKKDEV